MDDPALTLFRHITVAFLAVFGVLLIVLLWVYAKVCFISSRFRVITLMLAGLFHTSGFCKRRGCCHS